ncbi:hypothetical protein [Streptomyces sp. 891-h]|uniref:hypothetical protein n=1 Tax=Streptomyces sp. 891-h TaxID=2720714 RepID=UPI001FA9C618|nr:hypothetical protein [Streptomyces sp. 891-h]
MNTSAARHAGYAVPALWAGCAVFAALTAAVTTLPPHRVWGAFAACGYAAAALASLAATRRARRFPRALRFRHTRRARRGPAPGVACRAGPPPLRRTPPPRRTPLTRTAAYLCCASAALVPLLVLAFTHSAQEEVHVVHRAAARLLAEGTPYPSPGRLAGADYEAYNPYLPGMALFGVPHQLIGLDARFCFAAVFWLTFALSLRIAGARSVGRRTLLLTASPLIALPMAVGGDDLPVLGLVCLGLALGCPGPPSSGRTPAWYATSAGLVLGAACTLKATAWPALAVAAALLAARGGRPAVLRLLGGAAPPLAAGLVLPALADGPGLMANAVRFPLGMAEADSPAASPLPGTLLATLGPAGHLCAVAALVLAALLTAASLLLRPPRDASRAALRLALGLLLAMALLPASRFGHAVHPAVLALWAHWRTLDARRETRPDTRPDARRDEPARPTPAGPHADRDERLSAAPWRHRDVRPRGRTPVSTP